MLRQPGGTGGRHGDPARLAELGAAIAARVEPGAAAAEPP